MGFCPKQGWKGTVLRCSRTINNQTARNYFSIAHAKVLIDKTQGSRIFSTLDLWYSQECICYPIWSFWIPHRSLWSHEGSLDIPDADELTPGTVTLRFCLPQWQSDLQQEQRRTPWSLSKSADNPERQQLACKIGKMQVLPKIRSVLGTYRREAHCCPIPKNGKSLQSFLGFVNFYRRFLPVC